MAIKSIKRPSGPFPSLPSGMDKVLKEHFDSFMEQNKLPPELKELKDVKLFDDKELLKIWRSNFKGIRYTDSNGNIIRGAVDNILKKGKKLIVLDYKTRGYPLKEDTAEHYQSQMNIYNFLLRKNNYETEDYAYLIFYYPKHITEHGHVCFHTDIIKLKTSVKDAEDLIKKAIACLNNPIPEGDCDFCKYKNS